MLVEDDNNLREIYEARLQAEGYEVVSAQDGEEALVVAKKEHPELIISDVMMPKISGFEMLDILRNTDGLKNVKVIMLTALGQVDDKNRADNLGANRYLVKSQVTLEDIVKTTHELLEDNPVAATTPAATDTTNTASSAAPTPSTPSVAAVPAPAPAQPNPTSATNNIPEPTTAPPSQPAPITTPTLQLVNSQPAAATPPSPAPPITPPSTDNAAVAVTTPPPPPADPSATAAVNQANDAIMENAINQLVASTNKTQETQLPSEVKATEVPAPPALAAQNSNQPTPTAPEVPPESPAQTGESGAPSSRKVIKPLSDGVPKTDLNKLLAEEEAKEQAAQAVTPSQQPLPPTPPQATQPAQSPVPVTAPQQNNPAAGPNPNDIAL
jgi:CheY-like chemotaxis protein